MSKEFEQETYREAMDGQAVDVMEHIKPSETFVLDAKAEGNTDDKRRNVIPLRGMMLFPVTELHLDLGRKFSVNAASMSAANDEEVLLAIQKGNEGDLPQEEDLYPIGILAKIKRSIQLPTEGMRILVKGLRRVKIFNYQITDKLIVAQYEDLVMDTTMSAEEMEVKGRVLRQTFENYIKSNNRMGNEALNRILNMESLEEQLDLMCGHLAAPLEDRYRLLEANHLSDKMDLLLEFLVREERFNDLEKQLNERVRAQVEKNQKEYYLREKIRAIGEELGEGEDRASEVSEFKERLEALQIDDTLRQRFTKEINRLAKISTSSPEYTVSRNYIDTVLDLPWNQYSEDRLDIKEAEKILNVEHYGLKKVKERILESLAVRQLRQDNKGSILCLVGPPGIGKTSLARSIAHALNREYIRLSLGGVRDEAEIRGHRRTYVGAMPGRIIRGMIDAGTCNPVFLMDEIDKMANDFRGDPAAALLEVLDPEQNRTFSDHFIEVPYDLSKVLFITTANSLQNVARPLLDRMEIIDIPSYMEEEKVQIALRHLLPKQIKEHGLKENQVYISANTILEILRGYTKESGVRGLERQLATICRKVAKDMLMKPRKQIRINQQNLSRYLGPVRFSMNLDALQDEVGKVNGMAWTAVGGEVLPIEAVTYPGRGKLRLTGKLGEVMQESAQLGYSYICSIHQELGLPSDFYESLNIHIHALEGATPKDGPSAGVSMATAMISALTGRRVRKDVAMTGELSLRGKVLPIGGVREKVLAAHRAGCRVIILPKENQKDIEEIPENIRKELHFILAETLQQVLEAALVEE